MCQCLNESLTAVCAAADDADTSALAVAATALARLLVIHDDMEFDDDVGEALQARAAAAAGNGAAVLKAAAAELAALTKSAFAS